MMTMKRPKGSLKWWSREGGENCRMRRAAIVALLLARIRHRRPCRRSRRRPEDFQDAVRYLPRRGGGSKPHRPDAVRRGRPRAGSVPDFHYTADHKKLDLTWDAATLDKYLANPRAMVPDTSMVYAGLKNDAERADLIAYLGTLH